MALLAAMRLALLLRARGVEDIAERLYLDWYLGNDILDTGELRGAPALTAAVVDPLGALAAAHALDGTFLSGWVVERVSNLGRVMVRSSDGRRRVVPRSDVLPRRRQLLPPHRGDAVSVTARHDVVDESGFWFTFLNGWDPQAAPAQIVRFYWSVTRRGAPALVRALTNAAGTEGPAALKVGAAPHLLGRPDAAVLYLPADRAAQAAPRLRKIAIHHAMDLRERTPPLTLWLERGLAVAENPDGEMSFGQHRSSVIAGAAMAISDDYSDKDLLTAARVALISAGVDPHRPYRSTGSHLGDGW